MNVAQGNDSKNFQHETLKKNNLTLGERSADRVTAFLGSWTFILSFGLFLCAWIGINVFGWWIRWDPFPFILLNLALSSLAALQAPIIMMSQNRQNARDRQQATYDYAINKKAEREIENVQEELQEIKKKLDTLLSLNK